MFLHAEEEPFVRLLLRALDRERGVARRLRRRGEVAFLLVLFENHYSTPLISFLIGPTSTNMTPLAISRTTVTSQKSVCSGTVLKKPAAQPASLLPNALDRNHTPIIRPTMRSGASLVTALSPIGLTHSSPSSEMK